MKLVSKRYITIIIMAVFTFALTACAGTDAALNKRHLNVQTKMSSTVFLNPVPQSQKVVYVEVRNTSGYSQLALESQVKTLLRNEGYQITNDPSKAHFLLQANVLQAGRTEPGSENRMLSGGFGGAVAGAATGALVHNNTQNVIGGALVGAAVGAAVNSIWKDVNYTVTTDIQVSERSNVIGHARSRSRLSQGNSSETTITSNTNTRWQRYQTRIVSTANKVNLSFDEAAPQLSEGIARAIAGLF